MLKYSGYLSKVMMKKRKKETIFLFTDNDTAYFKTELSTFKKIVGLLGQMPSFTVKTINIADKPHLMEKYKIEALPTLIAKGWRFIGEPCQQKIVTMFEKMI